MPDYSISTKKTWDETIREMAETFDKWNVRQWRTEPQRPPLRANQYHGLAERTVTLRYTVKGREVVLTSSKQSTARDNLRVLYLVVEALRMNERRGLAETTAEAYRQTYPALPAPGQPSVAAPATPAGPGAVDPYAVLYVRSGAPIEVAEAAYRALAKKYHPDRLDATARGWADKMAAINVAIEAIRKERGQ